MKSLFDYEVLTNEVFYRCFHILDYLLNNKNISDIDKEAIKATIMDALVERGKINPDCQSLDLDNLCIVDNLEHYVYNKYPDVCGIPLWMKDKMRKKAVTISAGIPVMLFLAKPSSKYARYCVYDQNTAVSSIFPKATFYNCFYDSPTRNGIRIDSVRPFLEVDIDGELYLVDTLTKRIFKSSWFKKKYNLEIISRYSTDELSDDNLIMYKNSIADSNNLAEVLHFLLLSLENNNLPQYAEMKHEINESKKYFPFEWDKYKILEEEYNLFQSDPLKYIKKKEQE